MFSRTMPSAFSASWGTSSRKWMDGGSSLLTAWDNLDGCIDLRLFRHSTDGSLVWRMNFRQRLGWLGMAFYLLVSLLAVYHVFDVQRFKLEHVRSASIGPSSLPIQSIHARLAALPMWIWVAAILLPYIQLFLFIFSCTRTNPRAIGYCVLPICLSLLCKPSNHSSSPLIDT
ncbi:lysosomal enzyme trafficking factor isoform X2 [Nerophis lumbriciformis]|uniref:lysosomal enzyme trafficking factor isoform X2 n=1 Tax=Nerophis lumbriciformis TaxID=546530 RepID=UPI002AE0901E|nr:lysosomal enzyme trafficking factor isoform X2 [Nerophis lumbriciformis]